MDVRHMICGGPSYFP